MWCPFKQAREILAVDPFIQFVLLQENRHTGMVGCHAVVGPGCQDREMPFVAEWCGDTGKPENVF